MIAEATQYLAGLTSLRPRIAIVLGSGHGAFVREVAPVAEVGYAQIPGWPVPTAAGHAGQLIFGHLRGRELAVMAGRAHLYEGCSPAEVVFGVRVLARLGVKRIVLTNAAGGINPAYRTGELVLIADQINLQGVSPLAGPEDAKAVRSRFVDMTEAYSADLRRAARDAGHRVGLQLKEGVYAGVPGPQYETPAEVRLLRLMGADLVGMSTVLEVIAARQMGVEVLGISCVTNPAAGMSGAPLSHEEVLAEGRRAGARLGALLQELLAAISN